MANKFLITGATGNQGGSLIRALVNLVSEESLSITIHALVRDTSSESAQALKALGNVEFFEGNFDDVASIEAAARSCQAAFINVSPDFVDPPAEIRHARNIIAASKAAGVKRIIYSSVSVLSEDKVDEAAEGLVFVQGYLNAKKTIEAEVKASGFEEGYTLIRPAGLLTDFLKPFTTFMYPELASEGILKAWTKPDLVISYVDPWVTGRITAKILTEHPQKWNAKAISVASVNLTMTEVAQKMTQSLGGRKKIEYVGLPESDARALIGKDFRAELDLFHNRLVHEVDIDELKSFGIELGSWEAFFDREMKRLEAALGL